MVVIIYLADEFHCKSQTSVFPKNIYTSFCSLAIALKPILEVLSLL